MWYHHTRGAYSHPLPFLHRTRRLRDHVRVWFGIKSAGVLNSTSLRRRSNAIRNDRSRIPFADARLPHPSQWADVSFTAAAAQLGRLRFSESYYFNNNYNIIIIPKSIRYAENHTNPPSSPTTVTLAAQSYRRGPRGPNVFEAAVHTACSNPTCVTSSAHDR